LSYVLQDSQGETLDQADASAPFAYLHGGSQIVPGLESALEGLKKGDKKKVVVAPAEGYGEKNQSLCISVNRSQFPKGVDLQVGMQFEADSAQGEGMVFTIDAIEGDQVRIDGNHPLAGVTLHFDVEVLDVRDATAEELEHGHVHGPDGHHHH
jgi:FKBP-type peptidyl-prolyl cis-trans isomerase SlyD